MLIPNISRKDKSAGVAKLKNKDRESRRSKTGARAREDTWLLLENKLLAHKRLIVLLAMALVLALGWYVRFEDIREWKNQPQFFFHHDEPLLINLDGYFYLRLARDLTENRYHPVDELRTFPDHPPRPSPL